MKDEIKKKVLKPLGLYALAFSLVLPSLSGVVEAAAEIKESKADKILASQEKKIEENKKEAQEPKKEVKEEKKDESREKPQLETKEAEKEIRPDKREKAIVENTDESDNDELEISDENVAEAVRGTIPAPTIGKVFYGATSISGGNVYVNKIGRTTVRSTVHVTLKDKDGNVKADNLSHTPRSGRTWTVDLPAGVTIAEGDTVTAYQEFDRQKSPEVTASAEPSLAYNHKNDLQMPTGEIWIEKTNANIVSDDEQAEAIEMLKKVNPDIANDFDFDPKKTKFSIDGTDHAYYEVTYTDGSTSGKIEATDLIIKQVTETSAAPTIEKVQVTDGQIIVTLDKVVAPGTKFYFVKEFKDRDANNFCEGGNCNAEKSSPQEMSQEVSINGTTVTFPIQDKVNDLKLGREFGIFVKEPHKFRSCAKSEPVVTTPAKVGVRDPHKLTDADKKAIDKAIRDANTVNGKSKLPDGTGSNVGGAPAIIEISDDGKVKIISPNDVDVNDWDSDGNPIYPKNPDGTVIVKSGRENNVIHFDKPEELLSNLAPDAPEVKVEGDNVIVTPNKADTDAKKVEVTYTGKDGKNKTVTATKGQDGTWTTDDPEVKVDEKGVVTLPTSKVKSNTEVKAKVTDDGGIAQDDKDAKSSEAGATTVTASVQTPSVTVDPTTGDVTVTPVDDDPDAKRLFITYTPANGTEKTVIAKKDNDGKWSITGESDFVVSADGKSFTIKNVKVKANTEVKAITKGDKDDVKSDTAQAEIPDKTAPQSPNVKVDDKTGNVTITPPTDEDLKKVIVEYTDPAGANKTATATKDGGTWSISGEEGVSVDNDGVITIPYEKIKKGSDISAKAYDNANNDSKPDTNTQLPPPPTITPNVDTGVITVAPPTEEVVDGMEISYTPANSTETKTIKVKKGNDSKWTIEGDTPEGVTIDDNGLVTFAKGTAKENTKVIALSKIGELKGLDKPDGLVPDKTAPEAPKVEVQEDGSVTITPKKDSDTKTVTVTYKDQDGADKTATATKGDNDKWTVAGENGETIDETTGVITIPTGKSNPGDKVEAKAKDAANNESGPSDDTTKPAPPTVTPDQESGKVTITPPTKGNLDGMDIEYETPSGEKRTVRAKKDNNKWTIDGENPDGVTVDENSGVVTIPQGKAKEKTEVVANSTAGNKKAPAEKTPENQHLVPDKTAPEAPEVKVQEDGSVTITPKKDSDTKTVTVTYKDQDGKDKTVTATKGDNDKWTVEGTNEETINSDSGVITIPTGKSNPGDKVEAKAKDAANNESGPGNDTTKPAPPTVTPDQESGNVTITPPTKGNLDGMDIEYKTPDGTDRKVRVVKDSDNKWKIEGENPDGVTVAEDTGLVTIPKGKAKEKTEVVANSTAGDKKAPAEETPGKPNLVPDKTAPNPPTVKVDESNGNVTITPPSDEDTTKVTVTYKDKNGEDKTATATKADGKWTINGNNGETVDESTGVISIPKGNYKTEQAVTAYGNDEAENKSSENDATPVEITFDKNGGSKDIDSSIRVKGGNFVLPEIFASEFFPAGMQFAGWEVNGQTKKAGESIKVDANTIVKAIWKEESKPEPTPSPREDAPGIKHKDYTPTYPVYVTGLKTEKVPEALEIHKAYIAGYEDNTLRAEGSITRAEAAAMVTRLAGLDLSDNSMPNFKDMQKNAWYFRYINAAVKANMLDADNGMMRPNDKITRAEFAKMLAAIDKENSSVSKFDDIKGHRYEKEINKIYGNNRIEGYEDGSFRPDANLTRAESAAFLNRMFNRIADKEAYAGLEDKLARFKDFDSSKWYYDEMVEATNSHELSRRGKASDKYGRVYEKWTRILGSNVR